MIPRDLNDYLTCVRLNQMASGWIIADSLFDMSKYLRLNHISQNLRKQLGCFHVYCRYPKRKRNEQNISNIQRRIFDSTKIIL